MATNEIEEKLKKINGHFIAQIVIRDNIPPTPPTFKAIDLIPEKQTEVIVKTTNS